MSSSGGLLVTGETAVMGVRALTNIWDTRYDILEILEALVPTYYLLQELDSGVLSPDSSRPGPEPGHLPR